METLLNYMGEQVGDSYHETLGNNYQEEKIKEMSKSNLVFLSGKINHKCYLIKQLMKKNTKKTRIYIRILLTQKKLMMKS